MRKNSTHVALYMPTWTLQELNDANNFLNLGLDYDQIEKRFILFGGSARYCLTLNPDFYLQGEKDLKIKTDDIESFKYILCCLRNDVNLESVTHSIFHYEPVLGVSNVPCFYDLNFCSVEIERIVEKRIKDKSRERRLELVDWIKGNSKGSTLLGWLFEGHVNEIFKDGGSYNARSLHQVDQDISINFNKGDFTSSPTENYESIDGYIVINDMLYLIQSTLNYTHPVKALGIITNLKSLGFSKEKTSLVFVVSKSMGRNYTKQNIEFIDDLEKDNQNVSCIKGIGSSRALELAKDGIFTVKDYYKMKSVKFANCFESHSKKVKELKEWQSVKGIPQYVIELDVAYVE